MSIISFIFIPVILVAVIILFILYPKYYRSSVNKSLESDSPVRVIEPTFLYGGILFVVVIIISITTLTAVRTIQSNTTNLQYRINELQMDNNALTSLLVDLDSKVNDVLEQGELMEDIQYEVGLEDTTTRGSYHVDLSFNLTEDIGTQELTLYLESNEEVLTFEINEDVVNHTVSLILDLNTDYTIYVKSSADSKLYDVNEFNLYDFLYERFDIQYELIGTGEDTRIYILVKNYYGEYQSLSASNLFELNNVAIKVTKDDEVIIDQNVDLSWSGSNFQYYSFNDEVGQMSTLKIEVAVTDNLEITYTN